MQTIPGNLEFAGMMLGRALLICMLAVIVGHIVCYIANRAGF